MKDLIVRCERACSHLPLARHYYVYRYRPMVRREVDLAGLHIGDRILNVGCGPMPATAVNLAALTGAEITCIDHDPAAVDAARRFVPAFGASGRVTVRVADGRTVDTGPFDAVLVALHTVGTAAVIDNFFGAATRGDRLVVRYPRDRFAEEYGRPDTTYRPAASVSQVGSALDRSALFTVE
jgi:protein-L-isoaspartate O-methyltransferase